MMAIGVDVACSVLEPRHQHKLKVFLANNTGHELPIMVGDKIAALLVMPCDQLVMRSYLQDEENPRPLDLSRI